LQTIVVDDCSNTLILYMWLINASNPVKRLKLFWYRGVLDWGHDNSKRLISYLTDIICCGYLAKRVAVLSFASGN